MKSNTKLEVAIEILSTKIAKTALKGYGVESLEMTELIKEREEMYKGNELIIDKIIKIYGPEIKKSYDIV